MTHWWPTTECHNIMISSELQHPYFHFASSSAPSSIQKSGVAPASLPMHRINLPVSPPLHLTQCNLQNKPEVRFCKTTGKSKRNRFFFTFVQVEFSVSLSSQRCAFALVRIGHKTHLVRVMKTKWFGSKCLFWSPWSWMERVQVPLKNSWFWSQQKQLEISTGLLRKPPALDVTETNGNIPGFPYKYQVTRTAEEATEL